MSKMPIADLDAVLQEKQKLERSVDLHWVHWLVIGVSLTVTFAAYFYTQKQLENKITGQFDREASRVVELVEERMEKYEDALLGGVAAIQAAEGQSDLEHWRKFSQFLHIEQKYPGTNGIGVIYYLSSEKELAAYLLDKRKERPELNVYPAHNKQEYFPITYIEPFETNYKALGLDMAHEQHRYEAAIKARDTGQPQVTGPIVLVQDVKKTPGFLFFAPFYETKKNETLAQRQQNFIGMVYAPFMMDDLMAGTLQKQKRQVAINIADAGSVLYEESIDASELMPEKERLQKSIVMDMHGRKWTFDIQTKKSFHDAASSNKPILILLGGIFIDLMLFFIFLLLSQANERALQFANKMTKGYQDKVIELSESQARNSAILETATDAIITVDEKGLIDSVNPATKVLTGYTMSEIVGNPVTLLMRESFSVDEDFLNESYLENSKKKRKSLVKEISVQRKNGSVFPAELTLSEMQLGRVRLFMIVLRDVSEREHYLKKLELSDKEFERFATVASHHLQEPLRKMLVYCEFLKGECATHISSNARSHLERIISDANRMKELIQDLLAFSRLSSTGSSFGKVSTGILLDTILADLRTKIDVTQGQIEFHNLPSEFYGDQMQLHQLFLNLIDNSLKFHKKEEPPYVCVSGNTNDEGMVEITVKDNGIGFEQEYKERIFSVFQCAHTRDHYEGTGIGLFVCQKIVERHDGFIKAESSPDQGATFTITLPQKTNAKSA